MRDESTTIIQKHWKKEDWEENMMARLAKTRVEGENFHVAISLWAVIPTIHRMLKDSAKPEEDLKQINCDRLLKNSWNLKDKGIEWELIVGVPN